MSIFFSGGGGGRGFEVPGFLIKAIAAPRPEAQDQELKRLKEQAARLRAELDAEASELDAEPDPVGGVGVMDPLAGLKISVFFFLLKGQVFWGFVFFFGGGGVSGKYRESAGHGVEGRSVMAGALVGRFGRTPFGSQEGRVRLGVRVFCLSFFFFFFFWWGDV